MRRALLLSAALILSAACSGGGDGVNGPSQVQTPPAVASVTVSLGVAQLTPGGSTTATSETRSTNGTVLTGRAVTWSSSAQAIATVSSAGVVTAVAVGTTTISATSEGRSGSAVLTVAPIPVATVAVSLLQSTVVAGGTTSASASPLAADGSVLVGRTVTWSSSNTGVATVDASGRISAITPGTTTIGATSEGRTGTATLTVVPVPVASVVVSGGAALTPGTSVQLSATVRDANGATLTDRSVVWGTTNTGVAIVSANGLVTGVAPGTVTISASSEGRTGTVLLDVRSVVVGVTVSGSLRVKVGDSYQYTATARTANGSTVERPVIWSTGNNGVGSMTADGLFTPATTGSITLVATIDNVAWEVTATAYDWLSLSGSGSLFVSLPADIPITNKYGQSEYADLVFACSAIGNFFAWVSTDHFITASGGVALSFDGATPFSQIWDESSDFDTLFRPGSNASTKSFALQVATSRVFGFAFTEFRGTAKAMLFRVTGLSPVLAPLLAACPANNLSSPNMAASRMSTFEESGLHQEVRTLRSERLARAAAGPANATNSPAASLALPLHVSPPHEARRRP